MKKHFLKHDYKAMTAKLEGQHAAPSHVDTIISKDTVVIAPGGRILAVLLTQRIAPSFYNRAYGLWKTVDELPDNRSTAVGSDSMRRINKNGFPGKRRAVPGEVLKILEEQGVRQGILGYLDRSSGQGCRMTPLTRKRPELLYQNKSLIRRVDRLYAQYERQLHAVQKAEVEKSPNYRLWDTAFTTVYVVRCLRCAYHCDAGNLRNVLSAIMAMGRFTGGELVFPRWRIAIAFKPGDLLLFDPQQLHGNLPFEGARLSAIFYCERNIAECGK